MINKSVAHIALAVNDIEEAKKLYSSLFGVVAGETIAVPDQKVKVCFFDLEGTRLELIAPLEGNTSLVRFLEKRGQGLHHICLKVENIEQALNEYKADGIKLIDQVPRIGAEDHKIAFLHPSSTGGVLIELEELKRDIKPQKGL